MWRETAHIQKTGTFLAAKNTAARTRRNVWEVVFTDVIIADPIMQQHQSVDSALKKCLLHQHQRKKHHLEA